MTDKEYDNEITEFAKILKPGQLQTIMFSATFPDKTRSLAQKHLNQHVFVQVGLVGGACTDVIQKFHSVGKFEKKHKLLEILEAEDPSGTIVFVETKITADAIATFLCDSDQPSTSIHGDRFQDQREKALGDFKSGRSKILVATSVAARGLGKYH